MIVSSSLSLAPAIPDRRGPAPELFGGRGLHVPGGGHREHQWVVVDEILDVELTRIDLQARTAGLGEGLAHLAQLVDDDLPELVLVAEDLLQTVMVSVSSVCSVSRSARPRRVSRPSCMSRMWLAWTSEKATASPPPSG